MGVASMKKWYVTVTLLSVWLCQAGSVSAQGAHIPSPYGPARFPEPLPCGQTPPGPEMVPGPIDPSAAPPVPPQGTEYPADHTSAFQCEEFVRDDHCYVEACAVGWLRQKLGNGTPLVFGDPSNLKNGIIGGNNLPVMQNLDDIGQDWNFGPKLTVGYQWQNQALEVTGFWIPSSNNNTYTQMPGMLDLPFHNPPLGFEGDNGMWTHADQVVSTFKSNTWNAEINYRYTDAAITDAELILGVRYLALYETLGIFTGDDDLTFPTANGPDPTRQATYQVQTYNHIIAPQIGFEWGHACTPYFTLGVTGKAACGVNLAEIHTTLTRGDGLVGVDSKRNEVIPFAGIYEAGAFLDFNILEKMRLRVGYNGMFLVNVAPASDQIDFDLAHPGGHNDIHSTIFYHGPMAELQFLF
jgi:hypothetical protein